MTSIVLPNTDSISFGGIGQGALMDRLGKDGRMPPIKLVVKPLRVGAPGGLSGQVGVGGFTLDRFLTYSFTSSILIPVDTFNFNFVAPDGPPLPSQIFEGDVMQLSANDIPLATGVIDQTQVETENSYGEKGTINGRDLLAQLEDQDAISLDSSPIWANNFSVEAAVRKLLGDTRITGIELRDAPSGNYLFATEPGESKLAALQRFLEPLNVVAWMGPTGKLIIGKPNMSQSKVGRIVLNKAQRKSNVLSISVTRSAATIPNVIVPIWAGQETTVDRVGTQQPLYNGASGPSQLFKLGHRLPKTVVVATPQATDPQGLSSVNAIKAGGGNLLQAYAKREMARRNVDEMIVQAVVPGHFNEDGQPYMVDTVYHVEYDRGEVDENMYLFQTDYQLTAERGQVTNLFFCRLGTIVADVRAP